jgi:translation initiation factor IF-1
MTTTVNINILYKRGKVAKEEGIKLEGIVSEVLPNTMFRVKLTNGNDVLAYLGGKLRKHDIKILLGDTVEVEFSPYDWAKGRIVYRNK